MTTEVGPNLAEFRATLRDKLASMPPVGTQGREMPTPAEDPEPADAAASLDVTPELPAARMKPNPAQGGGTGRGPIATQAGPATGTPLDRIRALAAGQAPLDHDPTLI
jgi:hypothetical protein